MATGFIHTVYKDGEWINEVEDGDVRRVPGRFATRDEAVAAGRTRAMADETEHVIHNMDGTVHERTSYSNDPPPHQSG
jgi:hypothetical protein